MSPSTASPSANPKLTVVFTPFGATKSGLFLFTPFINLTNLKEIGDTGWNYLLFTKQRAGASFTIKLTNLSETVKKSLLEAELEEEFTLV